MRKQKSENPRVIHVKLRTRKEITIDEERGVEIHWPRGVGCVGRTVFLTVDGVKKTTSEWALATGMNKKTIQQRVEHLTWTAKQAIETPVAARWNNAAQVS